MIAVRIRSDSRPVSKQILSGFKVASVLIGIGILSLLVLQFIPVRRIEAYYWHLRHGNSVEVAGYRFPVPRQWYVEQRSANDVMIVDLNTGDGITVRRGSVPGGSTLATWDTLTSLPVRDGSTKVLARRELQVSGETMLCVEKNLETKALRLYPIQCRSESALEVTFNPYVFSAKDHDQMFYSLLQQAQKL